MWHGDLYDMEAKCESHRLTTTCLSSQNKDMKVVNDMIAMINLPPMSVYEYYS